MKQITITDVMNRLLTNPIMKGLRMSSAAFWMKDFAGINDIQPILELKSVYLTVEDYKATLPPDCLRPKHIYLCATNRQDELDGSRFEDQKLGASNTDAILREPIPHDGQSEDDAQKDFYGAYQVMDDVITLDKKDAQLEVQYIAMRMDENGFPTLPYDGSLLQSVVNYVKWKHTEMLHENDMLNGSIPAKAEREYIWYMGQYQLKTIVPTYDEAVTIGNMWTRLLDTRNKSGLGENIQQQYKW